MLPIDPVSAFFATSPQSLGARRFVWGSAVDQAVVEKGLALSAENSDRVVGLQHSTFADLQLINHDLQPCFRSSSDCVMFHQVEYSAFRYLVQPWSEGAQLLSGLR